jgi:hypothetical protein
MRQHMSAYVSIRQHTSDGVRLEVLHDVKEPVACVSICQHTSAYSIRQMACDLKSFMMSRNLLHTSAYVSICQHTSDGVRLEVLHDVKEPVACVSICQHMSAYVSICQHT